MAIEPSAADASGKAKVTPKGALPRVAPPLNTPGAAPIADKAPGGDQMTPFLDALKKLAEYRSEAIRDIEDTGMAMVDKVQEAARKAREAAAPAIYGAVIAVMRDIDAISKDKTAMGYKFRGIDDVYNELHVHLAKHGVFTVPEVIDERTEDRTTQKGAALIYRILKIKFTFFAVDGSNVSAVVIGEGMDSGDKASNKAMSVGHKYAFIQVFAIATKDDKDPENPSPQDRDGGIRPRETRGDDIRQPGRSPQPAPPAPPIPPNHPVAQEQRVAATAAASDPKGRKLVAVDLQNPRHADWLNGELDRLKILDTDKRDAIGALMQGKFGNQLPEVVDQYLNPPEK